MTRRSFLYHQPKPTKTWLKQAVNKIRKICGSARESEVSEGLLRVLREYRHRDGFEIIGLIKPIFERDPSQPFTFSSNDEEGWEWIRDLELPERQFMSPLRRQFVVFVIDRGWFEEIEFLVADGRLFRREVFPVELAEILEMIETHRVIETLQTK